MDKNYLPEYVHSLYADLHIALSSISDIQLTYGEILYSGVKKIIASVTWKENDIFYDLGSGIGKVVLQVFFATSIKTAYGIEIQPDLHLIAEQKLKAMTAAMPLHDILQKRNIIFTCADFLTTPLANATILLLGSPCYSVKMLDQLAVKINQNQNIRCVISLKPLPGLYRLHFHQAIKIECSWDSALCYIYGN